MSHVGEASPACAFVESISRIRTSNALKGALGAGAFTIGGFAHTATDGPAKPGQAARPSSTRFRWASISKTLLGVVAGFLAAEGTVDLDADISTYYKAFHMPATYLACADGTPAAVNPKSATYNCRYSGECCDVETPVPTWSKRVTLRLLLNHRAGIAGYYNGKADDPSPSRADADDPTKNTGMEWALATWINQPLVAPPDTVYAYTTFGFNLAAVVLEHATGKTYADLVRERVAGPLQLSTLVPDYEWQDDANKAHGYNPSRPKSGDVSWKLGAGGFISSVDDLTKYAIALLENTSWLPNTVRYGAKNGLWVDRGAANGIYAGRPEQQYSMGFDQLWSHGHLIKLSHTGFQKKARSMLALWMDTTYRQPHGTVFVTNDEKLTSSSIYQTTTALRDSIKPLLPLDAGSGTLTDRMDTSTMSCCQDKRSAKCPGWVAAGYCTQTYVEFMETNCKRSCNMC